MKKLHTTTFVDPEELEKEQKSLDAIHELLISIPLEHLESIRMFLMGFALRDSIDKGDLQSHGKPSGEGGEIDDC